MTFSTTFSIPIFPFVWLSKWRMASKQNLWITLNNTKATLCLGNDAASAIAKLHTLTVIVTVNNVFDCNILTSCNATLIHKIYVTLTNHYIIWQVCTANSQNQSLGHAPKTSLPCKNLSFLTTVVTVKSDHAHKIETQFRSDYKVMLKKLLHKTFIKISYSHPTPDHHQCSLFIPIIKF